MNLNLFHQTEYNLRVRLDKLMEDWQKELAKSQVISRADGKTYGGNELFCSDGFYPYYFRQKYRILFIAREAFGVRECDYIEVMYNAYKNGIVNGQAINARLFDSRLFYLTYGILQDGSLPYNYVPRVSELAKTFATSQGISFAVMELSKYSNEAADAGQHKDSALMSKFLQDSHLATRNFVQEELALLNPDLILTMNLWDGSVDNALITEALGHIRYIGNPEPDIAVNTLNVSGRDVPLFDLWHFSRPGKTETGFYNPVMRAWRNWNNFNGVERHARSFL